MSIQASADDRKKVLIVGAFPVGRKQKVYGGQVSVCMRLLESSFAVTHDVRTIDTTQVSNPPPPLFVRAVFALKRLAAFAVAIVFRRPDVAILFIARGASVYEKGLMARIAGWLRVPVMVFPRAGGLIADYAQSRFHAGFVRMTLGRAALFLCQGRTIQKFASDELGFDPRHAPVIPNWTASDAHLEIGRRRAPTGGTAVARILFLGWLEEFKGVFELLEAARRLREAGLGFRLTFGGDGAALAKAKDFVSRHNLRDNVSFAGWVDGEANHNLLRENDIFALPSWAEGLPNAMIEAMSAGLASVVADVGMISDYATDGRDALIVPPRDVARLTAALRRLIEDPALRATIAANGHKLAAAQFSLESGAQRLSAAVALATGGISK